MNEEMIDNLWRWFYKNEQQIIYSINNQLVDEQQEIVTNIDNLVLDLGRFSWEIAAGKNKPWSFTISPNGDKILLELTKIIIKEAPELNDWEFNYCKPAKSWDRNFSLYDEHMNIQQINASSWNYILKANHDNKYELILEAKNIKHLDPETANTAANLVVINEIGEEAKIKYIGLVSIVEKLAKDFDNQKLNIAKLNLNFSK